MTAPELVEVVAEVLRVHGFTELEHGYWYCSCGHELGVLIPDDLHADHQAAAVLAALTEAGTVEWGMQSKTFIDGDWDRVWTKDPDSGKPFTERKARNHLWLKSPIPFRLVSRLTFPWGPAE